MVSNDTMSVVLKSNKYKTCQKKITIPLTKERHVFVGSYFYIHASRLLGLDMDDVVLFEICSVRIL